MSGDSLLDEMVTVVVVSFLCLYVIADRPAWSFLPFAGGWCATSLAIRGVKRYWRRRKARQAILSAWANR